ncbi:hypothetical protein OIU84_026970 [Salix udensis]|uniref:Protein TIC 20 n=1 Tax=Salix udensis TaxID=889485 RepID=A0AAD6KG65_9ROSI|nr:hypothetical protein OIU84_026970 [Salix udensis]
MSATATTAQNLSKTSPLLAPAVVAAYAAYRYKSELADGCQKISGANKLLSSSSSVACESKLPEWPTLSISRSSRFRFHQHLHCWSSKENTMSCLLPAQRRSIKLPRAMHKNELFGFRYPVLAEKPEWWWRTLACVPYLIALQISDTGYFIQPFIEHYDVLGDLIYFVPGAITRLPVWPTALVEYKQFLSSHTLQWYVCDALLGWSGTRLHCDLVAVHKVCSCRWLCSPPFGRSTELAYSGLRDHDSGRDNVIQTLDIEKQIRSGRIYSGREKPFIKSRSQQLFRLFG